ncbi:glycoside hydrolase family 3 protein [Trametopsis cervina]|nr:glycoside hydrolase family 3 protein [Trametopsis cervina]
MATTFDVEDTLAKLSLASKIKLLTGQGWWHTEAIPESGVPAIRMSDGPNGVRGTRFFNGVPSSCFPASTGLGSSFDVELANKVGKALGDESRAKSVHVLLGPTINTQRSPLGGRGFESFSEDPHLNGKIAAAYVNGLQSTGVTACIKHFVANDQEFQRMSVSSEVSERALREIYMKPFQIAIKDANPWSVMTSYNRINGLHAAENKWLLEDVLRGEWGWTGLVTSDWTGTYSTAEAIKAGLDIEMPGPTVVRGTAVVRALTSEKLFVQDIDERVRNILETIRIAHKSGIPFDGPEESLDNAEVRSLLRTAAADAIVLLKNQKLLLPLDSKTKRIAVIGPNAKVAVVSGGGSAALRPTYAVSPLEGITAAAKEIGATVDCTVGAHTHKYLPLIDPYLKREDEKAALFEFWNEEPSKDWLSQSPNFDKGVPKAVWTTPTHTGNCFLADGVDDQKVDEVCWLRYTTTFIPDEDGDWDIGLNIAGRGNLFIDNKLVIELSVNPPQGDSFFGLGTIDARAIVPNLNKGQTYHIEIRLSNGEFISRGVPFTCRGGVRLGAVRRIEPEEGIKDAVKIAKEADIAILVIGLNNDWESEGHDRADMTLPGLTNQLVTEVLAANPNTVVVNQSGTPVELPWIDSAHTLLQAFYGGNEVGNGIADVLFGKVNPSGKLSLTFPKRLEDNPSYPSFSTRTQEHGKVLYNEGIFVGYRGYEIKDLAPQFPFGYGLSYTSFEYSALQVSSINADGTFKVTFTVQNVGEREGREVAQVYVSDPVSSLPRPKKELHGFLKVALKPGESKTVSIDLDKYALSFFDERQRKWVAEAGVFEVAVGGSSVNLELKGKTELVKGFTWLGL